MKNYKPDTVLMTADTIGGVWTYALELVQALAKYDITIVLATMGENPDEDQKEISGSISNLILKESNFALEWMEDPWDDVDRAGKWLLELEDKFQPDLVHLNNYVHGSLPWQAPVLITGHSCVLSWWQAVHNEPAPKKWDTYAKRVADGMRQADSVVGVTGHMLDSLKEYYGPFSDAHVIYNGRDSSLFYSSEKEPIIFSMGRIWDEGKNISSLHSISGSLPWPVYVAGENNSKQGESASNITYLKKITSGEVREWLSKSSIYVMPARYEPFGLSVLEAAFSGCALVLGDIPSLKEIWGSAAMYADPDDKMAIKHQVESLIKNTAKRQSMAKKALRRAQYFSRDRFGRQYQTLYRKLLHNQKGSLVAE